MNTSGVWFIRIVALLLLMMLGAVVSTASDGPAYKREQWKEFRSAAGRFRILFPGIPGTSEQTTKALSGTIVSRRFTVHIRPGITYDIMYSDYPGSVSANVSSKIILDTARDGLVHQTKGALITEKTIELRTGVGREAEIKGADATVYTVRLVLVGARLYQALVAEQNLQSPNARQFLDSFRIAELR